MEVPRAFQHNNVEQEPDIPKGHFEFDDDEWDAFEAGQDLQVRISLFQFSANPE